jgi:uncharacterized membrane protein (DUF485 family)
VSTNPEAREGGHGTSYEQVQASTEFTQLRSRFRRFVFPMTALFLAWYFLYVILAAFLPSFMSTTVVGNINVGLVLGLGQFVSTFVITTLYARWAGRSLDPAADRLREQVEGGAA